MSLSRANDLFKAKGATEQTPFFSTRSIPPSHRTSYVRLLKMVRILTDDFVRFVLPDGVSADELRSAALLEGVSCQINEA